MINNKFGIGFTNGVVICGILVVFILGVVVLDWADELIIKYTTPASTIKIIIIIIYIYIYINFVINNIIFIFNLHNYLSKIFLKQTD